MSTHSDRREGLGAALHSARALSSTMVCGRGTAPGRGHGCVDHRSALLSPCAQSSALCTACVDGEPTDLGKLWESVADDVFAIARIDLVSWSSPSIDPHCTHRSVAVRGVYRLVGRVYSTVYGCSEFRKPQIRRPFHNTLGSISSPRETHLLVSDWLLRTAVPSIRVLVRPRFPTSSSRRRRANPHEAHALEPTVAALPRHGGTPGSRACWRRDRAIVRLPPSCYGHPHRRRLLLLLLLRRRLVAFGARTAFAPAAFDGGARAARD